MEEGDRPRPRPRSRVEVDADTTKARKEIKDVEKGSYTAKVKGRRRRRIPSESEAGPRQRGRRRHTRRPQRRPRPAVLGQRLSRRCSPPSPAWPPNIVPAIGSIVQAAGQLSGVLGLLPAAAGAAGLAVRLAEDRYPRLRRPDQGRRGSREVRRGCRQVGPQRAGGGPLDPNIDPATDTVEDDGAGCVSSPGSATKSASWAARICPVFQTVMSQMAASANKALTGRLRRCCKPPAMQADVKTFGANAASSFRHPQRRAAAHRACVHRHRHRRLEFPAAVGDHRQGSGRQVRGVHRQRPRHRKTARMDPGRHHRVHPTQRHHRQRLQCPQRDLFYCRRRRGVGKGSSTTHANCGRRNSPPSSTPLRDRTN